MKKTAFLLAVLLLVLSCDVQPLGEGLLDNNNPSDSDTPDNSNNSNLALSFYDFNTASTSPFLDEVSTDTRFIFNSDGFVETLNTSITVFGETETTVGTYTRDNSGLITEIRSEASGVNTSITTITYKGDTVTQIAFDDLTQDDEDITYNFTTDGNQITRTELGSTNEVVYTFDIQNRLTNKVTTNSGTTIFEENLEFDINGNCISTTTIFNGIELVTSYDYDTNVNPLIGAFSDQLLIILLNIGDEESAASSLVQFGSENNWFSITDDVTTFELENTLDDTNRILSRTGTFNLDFEVMNEETFTYAND